MSPFKKSENVPVHKNMSAIGRCLLKEILLYLFLINSGSTFNHEKVNHSINPENLIGKFLEIIVPHKQCMSLQTHLKNIIVNFWSYLTTLYAFNLILTTYYVLKLIDLILKIYNLIDFFNCTIKLFF